MAVLADEGIRSALTGDSGVDVSRALVVAVKSLTDWPVDAFFAELDGDSEVVGWVQGNSVGVVSGQGAGDDGDFRANIS